MCRSDIKLCIYLFLCFFFFLSPRPDNFGRRKLFHLATHLNLVLIDIIHPAGSRARFDWTVSHSCRNVRRLSICIDCSVIPACSIMICLQKMLLTGQIMSTKTKLWESPKTLPLLYFFSFRNFSIFLFP